MPTISTAASPDDLDAVRELLTAYGQEWAGDDLSTPEFRDEIANLPGPYGPPAGAILIAHLGTAIAGCVCLRPWRDRTVELKRLYVRPAFRGDGVGRALVLGALDHARALHYSRMRLDTMHAMTAAQQLYAQLGFTPVPESERVVAGKLEFERLLA